MEGKEKEGDPVNEAFYRSKDGESGKGSKVRSRIGARKAELKSFVFDTTIPHTTTNTISSSRFPLSLATICWNIELALSWTTLGQTECSGRLQAVQAP